MPHPSPAPVHTLAADADDDDDAHWGISPARRAELLAMCAAADARAEAAAQARAAARRPARRPRAHAPHPAPTPAERIANHTPAPAPATCAPAPATCAPAPDAAHTPAPDADDEDWGISPARRAELLAMAAAAAARAEAAAEARAAARRPAPRSRARLPHPAPTALSELLAHLDPAPTATPASASGPAGTPASASGPAGTPASASGPAAVPASASGPAAAPAAPAAPAVTPQARHPRHRLEARGKRALLARALHLPTPGAPPRPTPIRAWSPMTGAEWEAIRPFVENPGAGRPVQDPRTRLDLVFGLAVAGRPWHRDHALAGTGPVVKGDTLSRQFRRWTHAGLWRALLLALARPRCPPALRAMEYWICRAARRAMRLMGLAGLTLARLLGRITALPLPAWMLPNPHLSDCADRLQATLYQRGWTLAQEPLHRMLDAIRRLAWRRRPWSRALAPA